VALRPEKVRLHREAPSGVPAAAATVEAVVYHGSESRLYLRVDDPGSEPARLSATLPNATRTPDIPAQGERVWLAFSPEDIVILEG
jgi:ABC-type Fe3+/spermidine/putrescine transport system ATPase subunit